ncbi:hypothetical protein BDV39DRAFT_87337 [Aspergillus sergii]|uniref:Uncharacterized protein n=1 Tax=Aspergillus sergii TaxID=1034303 RepID=A0A5N6X1N2_9EURO|nr:hypothetical protein BDV39DRAFT_87337 [Aspergillus sergii]
MSTLTKAAPPLQSPLPRSVLRKDYVSDRCRSPSNPRLGVIPSPAKTLNSISVIYGVHVQCSVLTTRLRHKYR